MKNKQKKIMTIFISTLILIVFVLLFKGNHTRQQDEFLGRQWYIINDGSCSQIEINPELCSISKFKKNMDINILQIWNKKLQNFNNVIIAVIDTGIDFQHEDLVGKEWINRGEIPNDGIDNDNNGYIDDINGWNFCENNNKLLSGEEVYENDHGTMVAGIIAANHNSIGIAGIAGQCNVRIMSIKILTELTHKGNIDNLIKGIEYAENMGADICNLSLGFLNENKEIEKIMRESSMLFVTSAGNQGENLDVNKQYPACYSLDNVITVASMGFDGELDSRSNYGKKYVDVVAPGTYLYSTCVNNSYNYDSGTSMATAVVTGIAAIIYANMSKVTPNEVKKVISKNVILLDKFENVISSGGYVDAKKAIEDALNL